MVGEIVLHIAEGKTFKFIRIDKQFDIYEQSDDRWNLIETAPLHALDTFIKLTKLNLKFYPAN